MLSPGTSARVYLAVGATDMRKSIDGLAATVVAELALDPLSAHWFVFCNRGRDRTLWNRGKPKPTARCSL